VGAYVFPADAVAGAPSYTGKMARLTLGASLSKNTARPVGARSGIHPATPDSVFSVAGSTWTVQPHCGVLDTEASATNGPYGYAFDTNQTGSVNAADATNPRWDLLSVQLSDPAAGDGTSTPGVAIVYTAGTAAASPSLPATPARSLALAQITVPQSGGGASSTTVLAPYSASASGIVRCRTSAEYPSSPYVGQYVDDAASGLLRWNGSVWVLAGEVWGGGEGVIIGSSPTAGARKITYSGTVVYTTNAFGQFAVVFPTAFPHGLVSFLPVPGDTASGLGMCISLNASCTLATGVGVARTTAGALITSLAIRFNYLATGW
jgi:hypothetical protein